jgi:hypothetical protein
MIGKVDRRLSRETQFRARVPAAKLMNALTWNCRIGKVAGAEQGTLCSRASARIRVITCSAARICSHLPTVRRAQNEPWRTARSEGEREELPHWSLRCFLQSANGDLAQPRQ